MKTFRTLVLFMTTLIGTSSRYRWSMGCMATAIPKQIISKSTLPNRCKVPWLNNNIVQTIRKRNRLHKDSKHANNASHTRVYTRARNYVTTMIRNAKWSYFRSFLVLPTVQNCGKLLIKCFNKRPTLIPNLNLHDGNVASILLQRKLALSMVSLRLALFHH